MFINSSSAVIESTVVRGTQPNAQGFLGRGINLQDGVEGLRGNMSLRSSLIERNHEIGLFIAGSDAQIEGVVVRDHQVTADMRGGRGIELEWHPETNERGKMTLRHALVEGNRDVGVFIASSDATIEDTLVRDTQATEVGIFADGIAVIRADRTTGSKTAIWRCRARPRPCPETSVQPEKSTRLV